MKAMRHAVRSSAQRRKFRLLQPAKSRPKDHTTLAVLCKYISGDSDITQRVFLAGTLGAIVLTIAAPP